MMFVASQLALVALSFDGFRWDEKLALSAAVMALAAIAWAFAYTTSEGALRPQRLALTRGADVLVLAGIYLVGRIWF